MERLLLPNLSTLALASLPSLSRGQTGTLNPWRLLTSYQSRLSLLQLQQQQQQPLLWPTLLLVGNKKAMRPTSWHHKQAKNKSGQTLLQCFQDNDQQFWMNNICWACNHSANTRKNVQCNNIELLLSSPLWQSFAWTAAYEVSFSIDKYLITYFCDLR